MKNSVVWWNEINQNEILLNIWLKNQYLWEAISSKRIRDFSKNYCASEKYAKILELIAIQEDQHASWIRELLESRGLPIGILENEGRYPAISCFEDGMAVAARAEEERFEKIRIVANDTKTPSDIRVAFRKILKDEVFHITVFRHMATEETYSKTSVTHLVGLEAFGLVA